MTNIKLLNYIASQGSLYFTLLERTHRQPHCQLNNIAPSRKNVVIPPDPSIPAEDVHLDAWTS